MCGMDHEQAQKQQLPFPFNKDLSRVLRNVARVRRAARERLSNSPVTAAYLAAGMALVKRHLGPGKERSSAASGSKNSTSRLLGFVSQREVVKAVASNDARFPRKGSVPTLRCTWKCHSDFIADLLRFGLSALHYPASRLCEMESVTQKAISGEEFVSAIHQICYWDLLGYLEIPMFRLQLVAAASGEGDEVIQEAIAERYAETTGQWKVIYDRFLRERRLQPRPGIDLDMCADLLSAVAEGLALRHMADPNAPVINRDQEHSLLGTAALALILGCFEPTDTAGGASLEEAVHEMARRQPDT